MVVLEKAQAKQRVGRIATRHRRTEPMSALKRTLLYGILITVALAAVFPFWWMIVGSTRTSETILTLPPPLWPGKALLHNYRELLESIPYWRDLLNTILIGAAYSALVLFFCSLGGYAFAKFRFPGRNRLFALTLVTLMIPNILGLIPMYMEMRTFGWLNTWLPLIVPGAANAFGIFWMRQYIASSVPDELLDAARIDGAGEFRIYWNMVLPIIKPALGALAIFSFLEKWNEFLWPLLILKEPGNYTLPVALASLESIADADLGLVILGATLGVLPLLIVFLFSARHFIAGLTMGAVQGSG